MKSIMSAPLVIKNGQFYRGNVRVPIAFGDTEQIQLIALLEAKQKHGECFIPLPTEEGFGFRFEFRCHHCNEECLAIVAAATDAKLIGKAVKCYACGTIHKVHLDDILLGPFILKTQKP